MEQAIGGLYQLLDKPVPLIVWCESPWQIMAMYAVLDKQVGREWFNKLPKSAAPEPRSSADFEQLWRKLWIQIDEQIPSERRFKLVESVPVQLPGPSSWFAPLMPRPNPFGNYLTGFHQTIREHRLKLQKELSGVCHMRFGSASAFAELTREYNTMFGDRERIADEQLRLDLTLFSHSGMDLQLFTQFNPENILNLGIEALRGNLQEEFNRICKPDQVKSFEFVISLITSTTMLMVSNPLAFEILPLFEYLCEMISDFPIGPSNRKRLGLFLQAAKQTRNCLLLDKVAMVSERPLSLKQDERGRLHSESGPAIAFGDGYRIYSWHGATVPADVIENPSSLTADRIMKEWNAEVRRVMIERFGLSKFIIASGAKKVQEDECGTLYRKEFSNDEALVMVKVINTTPEPDGTRKEYFLRVPPTVVTAREAVAWTFEMSPAEYVPQRQT